MSLFNSVDNISSEEISVNQSYFARALNSFSNVVKDIKDFGQSSMASLDAVTKAGTNMFSGLSSFKYISGNIMLAKASADIFTSMGSSFIAFKAIDLAFKAIVLYPAAILTGTCIAFALSDYENFKKLVVNVGSSVVNLAKVPYHVAEGSVYTGLGVYDMFSNKESDNLQEQEVSPDPTDLTSLSHVEDVVTGILGQSKSTHDLNVMEEISE